MGGNVAKFGDNILPCPKSQGLLSSAYPTFVVASQKNDGVTHVCEGTLQLLYQSGRAEVWSFVEDYNFAPKAFDQSGDFVANWRMSVDYEDFLSVPRATRRNLIGRVRK